MQVCLTQKPQSCSMSHHVFFLYLRLRTLLQTFSGRPGSSTRTPSWWGRWTTPESGSTRGNSSKPFTSTYRPCTSVPHVSLQLRLLCDGTTFWALNCLTPVAQGYSDGGTDEALFLEVSFISESSLLSRTFLRLDRTVANGSDLGGLFYVQGCVFSALAQSSGIVDGFHELIHVLGLKLYKHSEDSFDP